MHQGIPDSWFAHYLDLSIPVQKWPIFSNVYVDAHGGKSSYWNSIRTGEFSNFNWNQRKAKNMNIWIILIPQEANLTIEIIKLGMKLIQEKGKV
jgi:hypothetical protein